MGMTYLKAWLRMMTFTSFVMIWWGIKEMMMITILLTKILRLIQILILILESLEKGKGEGKERRMGKLVSEKVEVVEEKMPKSWIIFQFNNFTAQFKVKIRKKNIF